MAKKDDSSPAVAPLHDQILKVDIVSEMQKSYIDYAMSVITDRALPGCARRFKAGAPTYFVCNA